MLPGSRVFVAVARVTLSEKKKAFFGPSVRAAFLAKAKSFSDYNFLAPVTKFSDLG